MSYIKGGPHDAKSDGTLIFYKETESSCFYFSNSSTAYMYIFQKYNSASYYYYYY